VLTDARGVPLVVITTPANVHDSQPAIGLLAAMPRIPGPRGRPREKPDVALGDRAYGTPQNIAACRARGILPLLARIGADHGSGFGTLRWVVESCLAWFGHCRRLKLCYEKTGEHFQAFHDLAAALICARKLQWVK
jgi:transposase